jgi:hypothetical protein
MMPGQQQPQQPVTIDAVMQLLRDGAMRRFRIEIEVDSTIVGDESQERRDRSEFIQTLTQFMQVWGPMIQVNPTLTKLAGDVLLFGVRSFRVGRELEETIEDTVEKMEEHANQPPPPNPELVKAQSQMQLEQQKAQSQLQLEQQKAQASMQMDKMKLDYDMQIKQAQLQQEMELKEREAELEAQLEQQRAHIELMKAQADMQLKMSARAAEDELNERRTNAEVARLDRDQARVADAEKAKPDHTKVIAGMVDSHNKTITEALSSMKEAMSAMSKPKQLSIVRDKDGNITGGHSG